MLSLYTKAVFFIYLAFYVSAEPVVRHLSQRVIVEEPTERIKAPLHHTIDLHGFGHAALCDTKLLDNMVSVGGDMIRLRTADDKTFCNARDGYDYSMQAFSNHTGDALETRQVDGATITFVRIGYTAGTGFVGEISLLAAASVFGIGVAIVALWFLAKYLYGRGTESTKRSLPDGPETCCGPTPPPPQHVKVRVSYSDAGQYDMSAVNEDKNRDQNAAQTCVQQIENWNKAASGGCCLVEMIGSKGWDYKSSIGAATLGPNDGNFICYQENS